MKPETLKELLDKAQTVKWDGFNKEHLGSILTLQSKLTKHIAAKNVEKLKMYLSFCMQQWPSIDECPIDRTLLKDALKTIEANSELDPIDQSLLGDAIRRIV